MAGKIVILCIVCILSVSSVSAFDLFFLNNNDELGYFYDSPFVFQSSTVSLLNTVFSSQVDNAYTTGDSTFIDINDDYYDSTPSINYQMQSLAYVEYDIYAKYGWRQLVAPEYIYLKSQPSGIMKQCSVSDTNVFTCTNTQ